MQADRWVSATKLTFPFDPNAISLSKHRLSHKKNQTYGFSQPIVQWLISTVNSGRNTLMLIDISQLTTKSPDLSKSRNALMLAIQVIHHCLHTIQANNEWNACSTKFSKIDWPLIDILNILRQSVAAIVGHQQSCSNASKYPRSTKGLCKRSEKLSFLILRQVTTLISGEFAVNDHNVSGDPILQSKSTSRIWYQTGSLQHSLPIIAKPLDSRTYRGQLFFYFPLLSSKLPSTRLDAIRTQQKYLATWATHQVHDHRHRT